MRFSFFFFLFFLQIFSYIPRPIQCIYTVKRHITGHVVDHGVRLVFGRDTQLQTIGSLNGFVPGFQEVQEKNKTSRIRAMEGSCPGHL